MSLETGRDLLQKSNYYRHRQRGWRASIKNCTSCIQCESMPFTGACPFPQTFITLAWVYLNRRSREGAGCVSPFIPGLTAVRRQSNTTCRSSSACSQVCSQGWAHREGCSHPGLCCGEMAFHRMSLKARQPGEIIQPFHAAVLAGPVNRFPHEDPATASISNALLAIVVWNESACPVHSPSPVGCSHLYPCPWSDTGLLLSFCMPFLSQLYLSLLVYFSPETAGYFWIMSNECKCKEG